MPPLVLVLLPLALTLAAGCRGGEPGPPETATLPASAGGPVTVVSVGDILLADASEKALRKHGYDWPFEHVRPLLEGADLVVGNLEGAVTHHKEKYSGTKSYSYKARKESAAALRRAGFHAVSLANNHALDFGPIGLADTGKHLREAGVIPFGAGEDAAEARKGVVFTVGGLRIGLLGICERFAHYVPLGWFAERAKAGVAGWDDDELVDDVARLRRAADVVVVNAHWGENYKGILKRQRRMGRAAIDAGADLVSGHHPHVAQGVEVYEGRPILHSLGNFVFGTPGRYRKLDPDKNRPKDGPEPQGFGLVSRFFFDGGKLSWIALTPIGVNNKLVKFQPRRVAAAEALAHLGPMLDKEKLRARWRGDTAFLGFRPGWEQAALPALPFPEEGPPESLTPPEGAAVDPAAPGETAGTPAPPPGGGTAAAEIGEHPAPGR